MLTRVLGKPMATIVGAASVLLAALGCKEAIEEVIDTKPPNQPPQIQVDTEVSVVETGRIEIDASASSDSDGSITAWAWRHSQGPVPELEQADTPRLILTAPQITGAQQTVIELSVTDNRGAISRQLIAVTIQDQAVSAALRVPQVSAVIDNGQLQIQWSDAGAMRYRVVYGQDNQIPMVRVTAERSLQVANLSAGTYRIIVEAYDALGNSLFSVPVLIEV